MIESAIDLRNLAEVAGKSIGGDGMLRVETV
jgi:hypothetical protein